MLAPILRGSSSIRAGPTRARHSCNGTVPAMPGPGRNGACTTLLRVSRPGPALHSRRQRRDARRRAGPDRHLSEQADHASSSRSGPAAPPAPSRRIVGQHLGNALDQTVVVENKPGANGAIAATYVARSAPDGYTVFMSTNSPHSAAPSLNKSVPYDPVKDFTRGHADRQLHADPGDQSGHTGKDHSGADRLCQGQSGQADVRQRQHLRRRRRRDVQELGRHQPRPCPVSELPAGASTT